MIKDVIGQGIILIWPKLSLVLFFVGFLGICYWVTRKKRRHHYDYMARLTMDENEREGEANHGRKE